MRSVVNALVFVAMTINANAFTEAPVTMAVLPNETAGIYKVCYKAAETGRVKLSIYSEGKELIFSETMTGVSAFIRPYNFSQLPAGDYTIVLEDKNGKQVEKVSYAKNKQVESVVRVSRLAGFENKFLLNVTNNGSETIYVRILDEANNVLHEQSENVTGNFALIYNVAKAKLSTVKFEITSSTGKTETITY